MEDVRSAMVPLAGRPATNEEQERMDGSPAWVKTDHIEIKFQLGPVFERGRNGAGIEDVIQVVLNRLNGFQNGAFSCRENALAITKLEEALHWLNHRTMDRQRRGVEGKNVR